MPRSHHHFIEPRTLWRVTLMVLILLLAATVLHAPGPSQVVGPGGRTFGMPRN